jgi:hypothetical protein
MFSNGEEDQGYWNIINGGMGMDQQQGDVSESAESTEGKHALWAPPVFHDDSGDDGEGLFDGFAFGGTVPTNDMSNTPWGGGVLSSVQNPYKNVTGKADPRNRNTHRTGATGKNVSSQSSTGGPGALDNTSWEATMMDKFFGLTHGSSNYA